MVVLEHQTLFIVQSALNNTLHFVNSAEVSGHIEILIELLLSDRDLATC